MMDLNMENILDELNEFDRQKTPEIPKSLEDFILHIAKTGETVFPWAKIRSLIRSKLETVISDFRLACPVEGLAPSPNVEPFHYDTMRDKILEQFDSFNCAPFTIQRLCELLCAPRKHYKRTDKFMRGIEKNLLVVSTVDPEQNSRKQLAAVSSSQSLLNGVVESNRTTAFGATALPLSSFGNKSGDQQQQQQQRPSSVASISDADSGISDTEDEDKPGAESHRFNNVENQPLDASSSSDQPEKSSDSTETAAAQPSSVDQETPASADEAPATTPPAQESAAEAAVGSVLPASAEGVAQETRQEESVEATRIANDATTTAASPAVAIDEEGQSTTTSTTTPSTPQSNGGDVLKNKRPLELDEEAGPRDGDDEEHVPDAKLARFTSPDKVENSAEAVPCESPNADAKPIEGSDAPLAADPAPSSQEEQPEPQPEENQQSEMPTESAAPAPAMPEVSEASTVVETNP